MIEFVFGLDLVKCMVDVVNGVCEELFKDGLSVVFVVGVLIEV